MESNKTKDRKDISSQSSVVVICDICNVRKSMHQVWTRQTGQREFCCKCYVEDGGSPADWHPDCMHAAYGSKSR